MCQVAADEPGLGPSEVQGARAALIFPALLLLLTALSSDNSSGHQHRQ